MLLGPGADGKFVEVTIDSIEVQRKAVPSLSAGETGAVLISFPTIDEVACATPCGRVLAFMWIGHSCSLSRDGWHCR